MHSDQTLGSLCDQCSMLIAVKISVKPDTERHRSNTNTSVLRDRGK